MMFHNREMEEKQKIPKHHRYSLSEYTHLMRERKERAHTLASSSPGNLR